MGHANTSSKHTNKLDGAFLSKQDTSRNSPIDSMTTDMIMTRLRDQKYSSLSDSSALMQMMNKNGRKHYFHMKSTKSKNMKNSLR